MRALLFCLILLSCNRDEKVKAFRPPSDSSCLQSTGSEDSPFKNAYCYLPSGTSLAVSEEAMEKSCGAERKMKCVGGGQLDVSGGDGNAYSTLSSGSLGECQNAVESMKCGESIPKDGFTHCAVIGLPGKEILRWSEAKFGKDVVINQDQVVLLDENTSHLTSLDIRGILVFDNRNLTLTTHKLYLSGALKIGLDDAPFRNQATVVIETLPNEKTPSGLFLQGGTFQIFGKRSADGSFVWGIPAYDNVSLKRL